MTVHCMESYIEGWNDAIEAVKERGKAVNYLRNNLLISCVELAILKKVSE